MKITLVPQRNNNTITVTKNGNVLTINDMVFDFSVIPNGASLPASATGSLFFCGDIERIVDDLQLSILLPHSANPSPAVAFPVVLINPPDGPLELPK